MEFDDDMFIKSFINDLRKKKLIIGSYDNATFILALTTFSNTILSMLDHPYNIIFIIILDYYVIRLIYKAII